MRSNVVFIYTETNGLHQVKTPITGYNVHLYSNLVVLNYNIGFYSESKKKIIIKPENKNRIIVKPFGFIISKQSSKIHGITQEYAMENGTPIRQVLGKFLEDIKDIKIIISHNMDFNLKTLQAEIFRQRFYFNITNYKLFDLMELGDLENKLESENFDSKFISLKDLSIKYLDKDYTVEKKRDYNLELYKKIFTSVFMNHLENNNLITN